MVLPSSFSGPPNVKAKPQVRPIARPGQLRPDCTSGRAGRAVRRGSCIRQWGVVSSNPSRARPWVRKTWPARHVPKGVVGFSALLGGPYHCGSVLDQHCTESCEPPEQRCLDAGLALRLTHYLSLRRKEVTIPVIALGRRWLLS